MNYTKEDFKKDLEFEKTIGEGGLSERGKGRLEMLQKYENLILFGVNRSLPIDTRQIFEWLLGYDDFPQRQSGEGRYYWRKYLRKKLSQIGIVIK